jgi:hypothetical protein
MLQTESQITVWQTTCLNIRIKTTKHMDLSTDRQAEANNEIKTCN